MLQKIIAAACLAACTAAPQAHAAAVTLTGWAFGGAGSATVASTNSASSLSSYRGVAGAFQGSLSGTGAFDSSHFLTYCIELEESFRFSAKPMPEYELVNGADYFAARRLANPLRPEGAQVADRLGRLFTWAQADPTRVDTAAESVAMQLAVWNLVYDNDWSLFNSAGRYSDSSSHAVAANLMLAGAFHTQNRVSVWALTAPGTQDFIVVGRVPAPATLGLAAGALLLGAVALQAGRRSSRKASTASST